MITSLYPKSDFEFDPGTCWLMHCAEGPVPKVSIAALESFLSKEAKPWNKQFDVDFVELTNETRREAARTMGFHHADISLTATTSAGLVLVAQGLSWHHGDEILVPVGEFPSNIWPWKALESSGVSVRMVPLWPGHCGGQNALETAPPPADCDPETALIGAIGPKTRLMAVSWVRFQDGLKLNLERLASACKEQNVELVVDGIQGAGTAAGFSDRVPDGISAFASGAHKGLLSPQGSGFLWTSESFRQKLKPLGSWLSVEDALNFQRPNSDVNREWNSDGTYLEQGVPNQLGCIGFRAALTYINNANGDQKAHRGQAHIRSVQKKLLNVLKDQPGWTEEANRLLNLLHKDRLGSVLSFFKGNLNTSVDALLKDGFERGLYASVREGYLRLALHGWHDESDLNPIVDWLTKG